MNTTQSSHATRIKVGIFTIVGVLSIVGATIMVNNRPFWWRPCQLINISIDDATGLKAKSPVRSLGIEIGYLKSVMLTESHVALGICVTAPVEILPATRAYIRGEGFLGDKFVELKPVKYHGASSEGGAGPSSSGGHSRKPASQFWAWVVPSVWAAEEPEGAEAVKGEGAPVTAESAAPSASQTDPSKKPVTKRTAKSSGPGREVPVGEETQDVQHLVNRVDDLVHQMSGLTDNLKQAINPDDLRRTMKQLNRTLENASKTLAPEGGLNQTAQRTLAKLEDSIEQLRDMMTRVNKGEGSVGMLLNDPTYAEEIRTAIKNLNKLLNRVGDVRFVVEMGASQLFGYNGGRGWFHLGIWPRKDRYYLLGIASDPRGRISNITNITTVGGTSITTSNQVIDQTQILFTAMLGKVFYNRIDGALGLLYGDGTLSINLLLGPSGSEERFSFRNDIYVRPGSGAPVEDRMSIHIQPFWFQPFRSFYIRAGLEGFKQVNGQLPFFVGAGITFDDEDIKLLFTLR